MRRLMGLLLTCAALIVGCGDGFGGGGDRLSVAEYVAGCPERLSILRTLFYGVDTLGETRDAADDYAESLRVNPPPELVDFHNVLVDLAANLQEILDVRVADVADYEDAFDFLTVGLELIDLTTEHNRKLTRTIDRLDPDTYDAVARSGCIDTV